MNPITRKEMYLAKMSGDYSGTVPEPVTRMDYYMAYAAGAYSGPLPKPIRQQEFYWAYICGATDIELPDPVTRVDMYLAAICGGMLLLPEPITREEIYLAKIAKQSQYVVKTAAGKTIVLTDSLEAPFEDFHICGHTTQETTTGAQLWDEQNTYSGYVDAGGTIDIINTANNEKYNDFFNIQGITDLSFTMTVSATNTQQMWIGIGFYDADKVFISRYSEYFGMGLAKITKTIDVPEGTVYIRASYRHFEDGLLMLNTGATALPWEPYTGGLPSPNPDYPQELVSAGDKGSIEVSVTDGADSSQTLTISTPNGLPGIPVTSGGNYTDENGWQWICDEVDFGRGVYVQRVWRESFDGSENWTEYTTATREGFALNVLPENMNLRAGFCNQMVAHTVIMGIEGIWFGRGKKNLYVHNSAFYDASLEDNGLANWKAHLAEHPLVVMTYLDIPIETPLSAEELAAYQELHTNYPTTVITNDEDCWMEVGYKAKPISQYSEAMTLEYLKGE